MKVVVGLGNPGPKYAGTRHNVGFDVADYLAGPAPFRTRFQSQVAELREGGDVLLLVKPDTFMNLSGRAVRAVVDFYKLPLSDVLVVSDDFNLPLGRLRIRAKGSHGGQNGLRNIQEQLGTDEYARLRIGVGQPGPGDAVDFVLSKFKPAERTLAADAVAVAAQAVLVWARDGLDACMNRFNGGPADDSKKPKKKKDDEPKPDAKTADDADKK